MYHKLDSMRGLIAVTIVIFHSQFFVVPGGIEIMHNAYLCVDLLFMLSGFVLSAAYAERIRAGLGFRSSMVMRIGRLYPVHAVMMGVWLVFVLAKYVLYRQGWGGNNPLDVNDPWSFIASLFMLNSMGLSDHLSWNAPSWSISALVLAYISFFVFCKFVQQHIYIKALIIGVLGYGFIALVLRRTSLDITYDFGFLRCLAGFYTGVFCYGVASYCRSVKRGSRFSLSQPSIAMLEIATIVVFFIVLEYAGKNTAVLYGSLPLFAVMVLLFSSEKSGPVGKFLEMKPFKKIAKLAFSIYLTHFIVVITAVNFFQYVLGKPMQAVRTNHEDVVMGFVGSWSAGVNALLLIIVMAIAVLAYRYIEEPCRLWSRKRAGELQLSRNLDSDKKLALVVTRE